MLSDYRTITGSRHHVFARTTPNQNDRLFAHFCVFVMVFVTEDECERMFELITEMKIIPSMLPCKQV